MKRTAAVLVITLAMTAGLVAVAPSAIGAGSTFHFSLKGLGAQAGFTTMPVDGSIVPGVVYTDTLILTSQEAIWFEGKRWVGTFAVVDQFFYKFDHRGNSVEVGYNFGLAQATDVTLSVGGNLASASLSGLAAWTSCTIDRNGNEDCVDGGLVSVQADWTATGDPVRVNDTFHFISPGFKEHSRFHGTVRDARATASIGGADAGNQYFADIFNVTSADVVICHSC